MSGASPFTMVGRRRSADEADEKPMTPAEKLQAQLGDLATVKTLEEHDQPILSQPVRAVVFQWLAEMNMKAELEAIKVAPRRTALFQGPPGCGKTTLAQHISARLGVTLVLVDMQMIVGSHLGETGRNLAKLFTVCGRNASKIVVLLDEFDAIAGKRITARQALDKETNAIVIALLQLIDTYPGVLIAATNQADELDAALWRRFNMQVKIGLPDEEQRYAIIKRYAAPVTFTDEALETLTEITEGASPALLKALIEGLKRDVVLAPKFKLPLGPLTSMLRVIGGCAPHADLPKPPLWEEDERVYDAVRAMPWPPELPAPPK